PALAVRRPPLPLRRADAAPIVPLAAAFPEGGFPPFVPSAFYPTLACVLAVAALIPGDGRAGTRALRAGALLYAAAMIGAYVLKTPAGGTVDRLGALVTGPGAA